MTFVSQMLQWDTCNSSEDNESRDRLAVICAKAPVIILDLQFVLPTSPNGIDLLSLVNLRVRYGHFETSVALLKL